MDSIDPRISALQDQLLDPTLSPVEVAGIKNKIELLESTDE